MSSGFNDKGYSLSGWYNNYDQAVNNVAGRNIYNTTSQCGVYMFDGSLSNNGAAVHRIISSLTNMNNISIPNACDDAWLIYPGFAFKLYYNTGHSGTSSRTYVNTSNTPQFYYFANGGWNGALGGTVIRTSDNSTDYLPNKTSSVQIFFRGVEIIVDGMYTTFNLI
jgi:hypothetical protein